MSHPIAWLLTFRHRVHESDSLVDTLSIFKLAGLKNLKTHSVSSLVKSKKSLYFINEGTGGFKWRKTLLEKLV